MRFLPVISFLVLSPRFIQGKFEQCKSQCDKYRGRYQSYDDSEFTFQCYSFSSSDRSKCRNDCETCPETVCNPRVDKDEYNCPEKNYDWDVQNECKNLCDKRRKDQFGRYSNGEFSFSCNDFYDSDERTKCQDTCGVCPKSVCDLKINNDKTYNCPRKNYVWPPPVPQDACQTHCNNYRNETLKGRFTLRCATIPLLRDEKICRQGCSVCPKTICNAEKDDNIYHCPAPDYSWDKVEEVTTEKENSPPSSPSEPRHPYDYQGQEDVGSNKTASGSTAVLIIIFVVVGLALVSCCVLAIYCCVKKPKVPVSGTVPVEGQPGYQPYGQGQQGGVMGQGGMYYPQGQGGNMMPQQFAPGTQQRPMMNTGQWGANQMQMPVGYPQSAASMTSTTSSNV